MKELLKRFMTVMLVITLLFVFVPVPVAISAEDNTWNPGAGIYNISTEEDLLAFRDYLDAGNNCEGITVSLMKDISMKTNYVSPDSYNGGAEFSGVFEGNNHTISDLTMSSSDGGSVSLFPMLNNATIQNLTLHNVNIPDGAYCDAAFACDSCGDDKIINCHLTGTGTILRDSSQNGGYAAGFVADNSGGDMLTIENCSVGENYTINSGAADPSGYAMSVSAGFVAVTSSSSGLIIKNCVNRATITSDAFAAGFIAYMYSKSDIVNTVVITDSENYGNISTNENIDFGYSNAAGFLGYASAFTTAFIDKCANYGNVTEYGTSVTGVGGIMGFSHNSTVTNSLNEGTITADDGCAVGGIVGINRTDSSTEPIQSSEGIFYMPDQYNEILNCYNVGRIVGGETEDVGGIVGYLTDEEDTAGHSGMENCYNFGTVSGGDNTGTVCGTLNTTAVSGVYGEQNVNAFGGTVMAYNVDASQLVTTFGYYDSADKGGNVYPATLTPQNNSSLNTEDISDTPLDTDLRTTLDNWVDEQNAALEAENENFRFLPWVVSDGDNPHPIFGYEIINNVPESESATNGGYVTSSRNSVDIRETDVAVTLTVTPEEGFALESIVVSDADGVEVLLETVSEGAEYCFTMPESDVTINAVFSSETESDTTYKIYIDNHVVGEVSENDEYQLPVTGEDYYCPLGYIDNANEDDIYQSGDTIEHVTRDWHFTGIESLSAKTSRKGASVYMDKKHPGISFGATAELNNGAPIISDGFTFGMLITTYDMYKELYNNNLTLDSEDNYGGYVANIIFDDGGWISEHDGSYRAGVLNVPIADLNREFIARAYVKINYKDGESRLVEMNEPSLPRSIKGVSSIIRQEENKNYYNSLEDDEKEAIDFFASAE